VNKDGGNDGDGDDDEEDDDEEDVRLARSCFKNAASALPNWSLLAIRVPKQKTTRERINDSIRQK